jgi:acyl-CoA reductase-like NAD-dependent aldehyde dehydrogenase
MTAATVFDAPNFVAGNWIRATEAAPVVRRSPYSGAEASAAAIAGAAEVEAAREFAIANARQVRGIPPFRRAEILEGAAKHLAEKAEGIASLESTELGKPIKDTSKEVLRASETLQIAAAEARRLAGEVLPTEGWPAGAGSSAIALRFPVGIVLAITPFNAPLNLLTHKIAASFAAGNTTIVKSPPQAPGTSTRLVQILLEAGMPETAIQLLHGGADLGDALVRIPELGAVAFTGSPAAGKRVAAAAAGKRIVLELGGNAATIVCADADLADAAKACAQAGYTNSGQSCISVQRVYVEASRFDDFLRLFREGVAALRVGDPLDPQTDVGTMVDAAAASRVAGWVQEAVAGGGRLELGGTANGAALAPTVVANPPRDAKVVAEEVFGALVSVMPFSDFEVALKEANSTPYGLQGGLFTFDLRRVFTAIRDFDVGGLVINGSSNFRLDHLPFGGTKDSGIGRESPRWMVEDFTYLKTVHFRGLSLQQ